MTLDTLILELERVADMASPGEYFSMPGRKNMLNVCGGGALIAMNVFHDNAVAIAIRHNTAAQVISELKTQRARADRLHDLFLRVSEAAGLELFESPTVVLGEVKNLRARTDEARSIINELMFHMDPYAIGSNSLEIFNRATEFMTPTAKDPTP